MHSKEIVLLIEKVKEIYGENSVKYYGSSIEELHGVGFRINNVKATYSIHTQDGALPSGIYDIQIESYPPGEYLYTDIVQLEELMKLIAIINGPEESWPIL